MLKLLTLQPVAALADKYDIMDCLMNYATSIIDELTIDNICRGYQLAIITGNAQLKQHCERIICENVDDFFKSSTFLRCQQNVLRHILKLDTLMCDESDVFEACVRWAKSACAEFAIDDKDPIMWKRQWGDCFYLIRFGTMPPDVFVQHTVSYDKLFSRDDLAHIVYKDTPKFTPNKFNLMPRIFPEWNAKRLLTGNRDDDDDNERYYIQNPESMWFSTNKSLLLGGFECDRLQHGNISMSSHFAMRFGVKIIEIDAESFDTVDPLTKVIFTRTIGISTGIVKISLQRPIIIRPKKMYEIRMEATTNTGGYYNTTAKWPSEVKLNEEITLKFHQDPKKIECHGLVFRLRFNELIINAHKTPLLQFL